MITSLPSVQFGCKLAYSRIRCSSRNKRLEKRNANKRHRRALNRITEKFAHDPESFFDEGFNVPSMSAWDVD